ncbi:MAG: rRNA maturation RNase YbeY [Patescibacteria group bacterium]|nr:rRNA maturation RNase YbeY [Patescibacteria group bacterium]
MKNNLILKLQNSTKFSVPKTFAESILQNCLKKYKYTKLTEIGVLIVGQTKIRALNKKYRGKDCVTDVLSFPQISSQKLNFNYNLLGDIVICWPKLAHQAKIAGHSEKKELQLLLEHSFKHLIGIHHK